MEVNGNAGNSLDNSGQNKTEQPVNLNNQIRRKAGKATILLSIIVILLVAATLIQTFSMGNIDAEKAALNKQIELLNQDIAALQDQDVESAGIAKATLDQLKKEEIRWSEVISNINSLVPLDVARRPKVNFLSYSGSSDGKVNISVITQPSPIAPFAVVAEVIGVFNKSLYFTEVYVPSISVGSNDEGQVTLSFIINMRYQPVDTGSVGSLDLTQQSSTATESSVSTPRVPRSN